ncbi:hypothetical protein [Candidatus Vidania fulgoroideorum]
MKKNLNEIFKNFYNYSYIVVFKPVKFSDNFLSKLRKKIYFNNILLKIYKKNLISKLLPNYKKNNNFYFLFNDFNLFHNFIIKYVNKKRINILTIFYKKKKIASDFLNIFNYTNNKIFLNLFLKIRCILLQFNLLLKTICNESEKNI